MQWVRRSLRTGNHRLVRPPRCHPPFTSPNLTLCGLSPAFPFLHRNAAVNHMLPLIRLMKNPPLLLPVFTRWPSSLCPLCRVFICSNRLPPLHPHRAPLLRNTLLLSVCWGLTRVVVFPQEAAAVPTRTQEPVVPPTLVAVSTFPVHFVFLQNIIHE